MPTDQPALSWSAVAGAASYKVWLTDQNTGGVVVVTAAGLSLTVPPLQALTPGHSYTWYVAAVSTNGLAVKWNAGQDFKVAPLNPPAAAGPAAGATLNTDQPAFSWGGVAGAATYKLWVQDLNNGAVTTAPVNTGTSFTLPPALALTPGHSFIWYVAAVSTNGAIVTWNAGQSFNLAALAAPTGLSANSSASTLQPTFSWAPVSDAGTYQLWIGDQTGAVVTLAKLTTASYALTASQALKTGHNYTWYVAVVSTNGVVLLWSSGVSISV